MNGPIDYGANSQYFPTNTPFSLLNFVNLPFLIMK